MVVTWNQQLREGTSTFLTVFPSWGYILGMKVEASDPGRDSEWGRFRDKTNLRLAQGPPAAQIRDWESDRLQEIGEKAGAERGRGGPA